MKITLLYILCAMRQIPKAICVVCLNFINTFDKTQFGSEDTIEKSIQDIP